MRNKIYLLIFTACVLYAIAHYFSLNKCYVYGNMLHSSVGDFKLKACFSERHECKVIPLRSEWEYPIRRGKFEVHNFKRKPSYMVDSKSNFVRWRWKNGTLTFFSDLQPNETRYFFPIFGNDENVTVLFIFGNYTIVKGRC